MSLGGNDAIKEALRRAQSADAGGGLEGLDVGPDERGLLPIFHLVMPEPWAPVPEAARVRVLDWLLDAGADGDACTPGGSSVLEIAIENALDGVARRLLERGAAAHVDSAGLALVFRGFVAGPAAGYPMSMTLEGDLPISEGPDSVDTARATSWFGDASLDPIRPFAEVPFPVESKPKKKTLAVVRHEAGRGLDVLRATGPIEEGILPKLGSVAFDAAARTAAVAMDGKPGDTQTEIVLKTYRLGEEPTGVDMPLLRTLVLHAMAAVPGVTGLRWCDEPEQAPAKAASDTKARQTRKGKAR